MVEVVEVGKVEILVRKSRSTFAAAQVEEKIYICNKVAANTISPF